MCGASRRGREAAEACRCRLPARRDVESIIQARSARALPRPPAGQAELPPAPPTPGAGGTRLTVPSRLPAMGLLERWRATGADLPFGDPGPVPRRAARGLVLAAGHPRRDLAVTVVCGVLRSAWAEVVIAVHPSRSRARGAAPWPPGRAYAATGAVLRAEVEDVRRRGGDRSRAAAARPAVAGARARAPAAALPPVLGAAARRHRAGGRADDRRGRTTSPARGPTPRRAGARASRPAAGGGARRTPSRTPRWRCPSPAGRCCAGCRSRPRPSWPAPRRAGAARHAALHARARRAWARAGGTSGGAGRARAWRSTAPRPGRALLLPHPEPEDGTLDRRAEHWLDGRVEAAGRGPPRRALAHPRRGRLAAGGPGAGPAAAGRRYARDVGRRRGMARGYRR